MIFVKLCGVKLFQTPNEIYLINPEGWGQYPGLIEKYFESIFIDEFRFSMVNLSNA